VTAPVASCPTCGSASIQAVTVERKKIGQAVLAEYFLGTAAGVAAGSSTVVQNACLACGQQWFPGTEQERQLRALAGQLGETAKRAEVRRREEAEKQKVRDRRTTSIAVFVFLLLIVAGLIWMATHPQPLNP
jgi:hypothetical protein